MRPKATARFGSSTLLVLVAVLSLLCGPRFFCECRGVVVSTTEMAAGSTCCAEESDCAPKGDGPDDSESCMKPLPWDLYSVDKADQKAKARSTASDSQLDFILQPQAVCWVQADARYPRPPLRRSNAIPPTPVFLRFRVLLI